MRRSFLRCIFALVSAFSSVSGIAGEEVWYNADGEVIKTVNRAPAEAGGRKIQTPAWEPAWVIRERERSGRGYPVFRPDPGWSGHRYYRVGLYPRTSRFYLRTSYRGWGSSPIYERASRFFRYQGFSGILIR